MIIYNIDYVADVKCRPISNIVTQAAIYQLQYAIDVLSFKIKYLFWNPPE